MFTELLNHFTLLLCLSGMVAALYVAGAAICRMGLHPGPSIKHGWKIMYVSIFGLSIWLLADMLTGQASLRDHVFALAVAAYIRLTTPVWRTTVPLVAQAHAQASTPTAHTP